MSQFCDTVIIADKLFDAFGRPSLVRKVVQHSHIPFLSLPVTKNVIAMRSSASIDERPSSRETGEMDSFSLAPFQGGPPGVNLPGVETPG
jgi:hypothetical protein